MRDTKQQWFKEAKYGLFIHFGLYALLAGEYNGKRTSNIAEWIMNDLDIPVKEYEKLATEFNPVQFNAEEYVLKAKEWGMKYITFTAKHHEGFAMYHSKCSSYNIVEASPYGKDMVGELAKACQKHGMKLCLYYSQAQDWHHPHGYRANHNNSHKNFRRYLDEKCIPQIREILTQYGEIGMIWFDTPMGMTKGESQELFDLVKSIQPNCIVSGRIGNELGEYLTTGDNDIPSLPFYGDWEVPATLNDTWGFNKYDENWKDADKILRLLIKINSRGGNYLLNIGPKADGSIPQPSIDILDKVGAYLKLNGDSIFGTQAVPHYVYDMDNILLTAKPYKAFIHMMTQRKRLVMSNVASKIKAAYMLKDKEPVVWEMRKNCEGDDCWIFTLPQNISWDNVDTVMCVEIEEEGISFEELR